MSDWHNLRSELDAWHRDGRTATFWWRDDDAIEPTAALRRLLDLAARGSVPLAIAVVPGRADAGLAGVLRAKADIATPLQHGYGHVNHSPAEAKKAELGDGRPVAAMLDELARGQAIMTELFGDAALPVLVPPWNRISAALTESLPGLGFRGLSCHGARRTVEPVPGLIQTNAHVDILRWRPRRGFLGTAQALGLITGHLTARRCGDADAGEPTGLLTHHLVHDAAAWSFLGALLAMLGEHPAARFVDTREAFAATLAGSMEGAA